MTAISNKKKQFPINQTLRSLLDAIAEWNGCDLSKMTESEVSEAQHKVLTILIARASFYKEDLQLFRIRRGGLLSSEKDLWLPENQKPSRVSCKTKPRILYTSTTAYTAMIEADVMDGQEYNMITYKMKSGCRLLANKWMQIKDTDDLEENEYLYLRVLENFFTNEFQRHVTESNSFQYLSTQSLCWNFLDKATDKDSTIDAFQYRSVANFGYGINLAIKEGNLSDAKNDPFGTDKLEISKVQRCKFVKLNESGGGRYIILKEASLITKDRIDYTDIIQ